MHNLTLRPATMDDAERLFAWRNDPETCAASVNAEPVEWPSHVSWLRASIGSSARQLLIAEADDIPVATVRIDAEDGAAVLSWTVAPEHRGHGIGAAAVSLCLSSIDGPTHAHIKHDNIASQRIATRCGFVLSSDGPMQTWTRAGS